MKRAKFLSAILAGALLLTGCSESTENKLDAAESYMSDDNYKKAIKAYEEILKEDPENVDAYLGLAEAYEKSDDIDKAIEILEEGFEKTEDKKIEKRLKKLQDSEEDSDTYSAESKDDTDFDIPIFDDDNDKPDKYSDEETLTILAWSGNSDVQPMIDFFCEETGVNKARIKWAQVGANDEEARDQYTTYLDGDQDADIIICDAEWTAVYTNSDYTVPLSKIGINKGDYSDAYDYTLNLGTNDNGEFKAVTWQATPGGFVYRADYAEQYLGVKTPEEMQELVKDWPTFEATAAKLYAEHQVSLCASEGGLWQIMQCQMPQPWVVNGKLEVNDFAKQFIRTAKDYVDKGYVSKATQWRDDEWYPTVQQGKALGDFAPTWGLTDRDGTIAKNFSGGEDGVMGLCEGPARYYWGGSFMQVTKKCNTKDLAKQWIEFYTVNADSMKAYQKETGDFVNNKTVMNKISNATNLTNEMYKGGIHQFGVLCKAVEGINVTASPYDSVVKGAFNEAVQGYAVDGRIASVDEAIELFKSKVAEKYKDIV